MYYSHHKNKTLPFNGHHTTLSTTNVNINNTPSTLKTRDVNISNLRLQQNFHKNVLSTVQQFDEKTKLVTLEKSLLEQLKNNNCNNMSSQPKIKKITLHSVDEFYNELKYNEDISDDSMKKYTEMIHKLSTYKNSCEEMMDKIQKVISVIEQVHEQYDDVSSKTKLHRDCETLVQERVSSLECSIDYL